MEGLKSHNSPPDTNHSLWTRQELGAEMSKEQKQAIKYLCEIGFLTPVSRQNLYHGRKKESKDEVWAVDPNFNNAENNSGNNNINHIPALNVASKDIASEFARHRANGDRENAEVHKIVSRDPLATTVNLNFSYSKIKNNHEYLDKYYKAMSTLIMPVRQGITFDFQTKGQDIFGQVKPSDFNAFMDKNGYIPNDSADKIAKSKGIDEQNIKRICGALNTVKMLQRDPKAVFYNFLDNTLDQDGISLDSEYIKNFLKNNHIIGANFKVHSATLDETIPITQFFNLYEVDTASRVSAERKARERMRYQNIGAAVLREYFGQRESNTERSAVFWNSIENLSSKPEEYMHKIKEASSDARRLLSLDAGNWEGYNVAQHTETTLRLFEDNYANSIPSGLVPLTRLSLIMHDIGKGESVRHRDKKRQREYNRYYSNEIMKQLGTNPETRQLVCGMITDAQIFTTDLFVRKDQLAEQRLASYSESLLRKCGFQNINGYDVKMISTVCKIIQSCDSMAYTTIGVVRDFDGKKFHSSSSSSFNSNFMQHGFVGEKGTWKG